MLGQYVFVLGVLQSLNKVGAPAMMATLMPFSCLKTKILMWIVFCWVFRAINYDEKDPFLCNACGFCKYAKFDFTLTTKPCCAVDPIENDEDRKKVSSFFFCLNLHIGFFIWLCTWIRHEPSKLCYLFFCYLELCLR